MACFFVCQCSEVAGLFGSSKLYDSLPIDANLDLQREEKGSFMCVDRGRHYDLQAQRCRQLFRIYTIGLEQDEQDASCFSTLRSKATTPDPGPNVAYCLSNIPILSIVEQWHGREGLTTGVASDRQTTTRPTILFNNKGSKHCTVLYCTVLYCVTADLLHGAIIYTYRFVYTVLYSPHGLLA